MVRITRSGGLSGARGLGDAIKSKMLEMGMTAIEQRARGAAASIVDPETGQHADVFVDRVGDTRVRLQTSGSPAFARLLEARLGVQPGEVEVLNADGAAQTPRVYLAHASEDKAMVRPIAEYLMAHGIDVWFDEWEIEPGDSLRQKMEAGLGEMTHFVVILTKTSITKPWVAKEIDVGLVRQVGGESRFVPVVIGLDPKTLSPFVRAMLFVPLDPEDEAQLKGLVDRLHGVSRKPALGTAPRYVQRAPAGLQGWSAAAAAVGRDVVETSQHATASGPVVTLDSLRDRLDLDPDDLRIAVLDLKDGGLLKELNIRGHYLPTPAMFVEFDEAFMPFSPKADARVVANHMVNGSDRAVETKLLAAELDWEPRRMNSAICYLERAGAIETRQILAGGPWRAVQLIRTDDTLRFARRHG